MTYTTLLQTAELAPHVGDPNWAIIDCRFALGDPDVGRQRYLAGHIPGAVYAHLDEDLSGSVVVGVTGRHPLPVPDLFARTLSRWGIDSSVQVVAYDDMSGVFAGRLWWMLRWMGHEAVAILDGDFRRWKAEARPVIGGEEHRAPRRFVPNIQEWMVADVDEVMSSIGDDSVRLLDARSEDRYRGENETLDPRGGHIPGARSAAYAENLDAEGVFLSPEALRSRYEKLLDNAPADKAILYCGSGVSAAHDLLAMVHAGMNMSRLYVGSWSHWCTDETRPMATGPEA